MAFAPELTIAYTPASDDAFYYFAMETGRVRLPGLLPEFIRQPLSALNRAARAGTYHVTAISSVIYPLISDQYAVLSVGTSVGRGYGPVLVGRQPIAPEQLRGRRVGVGGIPSTGWFLLRCLCPDAVAVEMPFEQVGAAVASGEVDAGVMIHEELLYYPRLGLHPIVDLAAWWCEEIGLPLPVGLNVIRRDLGREMMQEVCAGIRQSLHDGLQHRVEAMAWASRFGRGAEGACTERLVEMFANDDSAWMAADVRQGLNVLFAQVVDLGIGDAIPVVDIIEGTHYRSARRA
jgi:1,4-dihydroxy-6-naphthoate synthase